MILPNCKPSTDYFPFLIVKDSKNAFFKDENLVLKFAGYKDLTLLHSVLRLTQP
jgi:hypothetical protein